MTTVNIPNNADLFYVIFTAEIVQQTVEELTSVLVQAARRRVKKVYLALSTPGGQVAPGVTLYNTLIGMPFELTTHNIGSVDSVGNVIFLAGDTRYATPSSSFLFHGVGFDVMGPERIDEKVARERLDSILADQKRMGDIICGRSNLSTQEVAELFRVQRTVDTAWAKDHGIIEDIRNFDADPGYPIVSFVIQRQ